MLCAACHTMTLVHKEGGRRLVVPFHGPIKDKPVVRFASDCEAAVWKPVELSCRTIMKVPVKAQGLLKFISRWIDSSGGWRYSLAQIPDLVANAIPRFRPTAQSFGSALPHARWYSTNCIKRFGELADTQFIYVPVPVVQNRNRTNSTRQRRTGGHLFL
jgi:hypothetical protein